MKNHKNQEYAKPTATAPEIHITPHIADTSAGAPTHAEIATRAYEIYLKSGRQPGHCTQNWAKAEQSLRDQGHAAHVV